MPKDVVCKYCGSVNQHYSFKCYNKPNKGEIKPSKKTSIKTNRKPSGELKLFLEIYSERKGICEITGKQLPFDVNSFAHVLSKGAYPSLRLDPDNICFCDKEIHHLYDNSSREKLLEKFPEAIVIYERKEALRYKYYNG